MDLSAPSFQLRKRAGCPLGLHLKNVRLGIDFLPALSFPNWRMPLGVHGGTQVFPAGPGVEPGGLSSLHVASFAKVVCMLGRKTYTRKEIDSGRAMVGLCRLPASPRGGEDQRI